MQCKQCKHKHSHVPRSISSELHRDCNERLHLHFFSSSSLHLPPIDYLSTSVCTMFAARQSFNLFQKRAFSASASQVLPYLYLYRRPPLLTATYRPPRSPSLVPAAALASPCRC